jgi:hypothetical protein
MLNRMPYIYPRHRRGTYAQLNALYIPATGGDIYIEDIYYTRKAVCCPKAPEHVTFTGPHRVPALYRGLPYFLC